MTALLFESEEGQKRPQLMELSLGNPIRLIDLPVATGSPYYTASWI
ncbi:hypothetical protein ACJ73_10225 [Blastomyces percursus]|uniref:Uncharacterized protein n=1 Tax=Blastomyces percursus TaxID=1658174 RepID=A0A1J9P009_9EURO|nr:hypothetical protein ACJ73_10225 [Blastomyces percursus]